MPKCGWLVVLASYHFFYLSLIIPLFTVHRG